MNNRLTHADRDQVKRRAGADLLSLYLEHGGRRLGRALFCLFHQNERTPAASIYRSRYHCFSCGLNLDVIEFVQRIRGIDFKTALSFLADRYGVALDLEPLSPADRVRFAEADREAQIEAEAMTTWRRTLIEVARAERNEIWELEQQACRWARAHLGDEHAQDPRWELVWFAVMRQIRGDQLNRTVKRITSATPAELLPLWRAGQMAGAA